MKRKKFSPFDRLLLFALAIGVLLVYVRYRSLNDSPLTADGEQGVIKCVLQTDSRARAEALAEAKEVFFADTHTRLGTPLKPIEITPAYTEGIRSDGTISYLPSENAREVRFTLLASGSFTENGFYTANGRHITANQRLLVTINGLNVTMLVLNVSRFSSK